MPRRAAPLSELGRLRLARCAVDDGVPIAPAAERFPVSPPDRDPLEQPLPSTRPLSEWSYQRLFTSEHGRREVRFPP